MSQLEATITLLQGTSNRGIRSENAKLQLTMTRLLAKGAPVSAQALAQALGEPVEFVSTAFQQLQRGGCEFNERGELIGSALTLTPTRHRLEVDGTPLYAWCALDTLFLPAYIGKPAQVSSTCPQTHTTISLTVTPHRVETVVPDEAVVSIMTGKGCTAGIEGTFCGQVHFLSSREAAEQWINSRPDFTILTVAEAYQLADEVYIQPILKYHAQ